MRFLPIIYMRRFGLTSRIIFIIFRRDFGVIVRNALPCRVFWMTFFWVRIWFFYRLHFWGRARILNNSHIGVYRVIVPRRGFSFNHDIWHFKLTVKLLRETAIIISPDSLKENLFNLSGCGKYFYYEISKNFRSFQRIKSWNIEEKNCASSL